MRNLILAFSVVVATSCGSSSSRSSGTLRRSDDLQTLPTQAIPNWQNLDLEQDGVFGISTEKAYAHVLKGLAARPTIVAVLDDGIDTAQDDIRPVLWTDPKDGSHGRNFMGPETGKEDFIPVLEANRSAQEYQITLDDYHLHVKRLEAFISKLNLSKRILDQILKNIGSENPDLGDLRKYQPRNEYEGQVLSLVVNRMPEYPNFKAMKSAELDKLLETANYHLAHGLKMGTTVDNYGEDIADSSVADGALGLLSDPPVPSGHGTMMAGIIAGVRNNGKGINGVADHVQILTVKLFSNIREMRNDNLAIAVRYAVDHGARVISMSFGKQFSWHRPEVDSAVQYAMAKDVLLIHSAGNNGQDIDLETHPFFPSPKYLNGGVAVAWITVGASGLRDDSTLAAPFSNYGHKTVDVFAPGVQITSTLPHSGLAAWDGTSEATPVVAGLAALIREYYPTLTAIQVKEIILKTVTKSRWLREKCVSGGVVNAYNALKLAAAYK